MFARRNVEQKPTTFSRNVQHRRRETARCCSSKHAVWCFEFEIIVEESNVRNGEKINVRRLLVFTRLFRRVRVGNVVSEVAWGRVQLDTTDGFLQCALNYLLFPRCVFLLSFRVWIRVPSNRWSGRKCARFDSRDYIITRGLTMNDGTKEFLRVDPPFSTARKKVEETSLGRRPFINANVSWEQPVATSRSKTGLSARPVCRLCVRFTFRNSRSISGFPRQQKWTSRVSTESS